MSGCTNASQVLRRGLKTSSSPRITNGLPFLYQTATIRRCYGDFRSSTTDYSPRDTLENSGKRASYGQGPRTRRTAFRDPSTSRDSGYEPRRASKDESTPSRRPFRSESGIPLSKPFRKESKSHEDFVPFEDVAALLESIIPKPAEGTTITPTEQRTFEKLEGLVSSPKPSRGKKTGAQDYISLDDVLNEAISKIETMPLDPYPRQKPTKKKAYTPKDSPEGSIRKIAHEPPFRSSTMDAATTDLELWNIVEQDVFQLVSLLDLEGANKDDPKLIKDIEDNANARRVIMSNFPAQLTTAASLFRTSFPTSNRILSILPRLRALGPSAHALGASTRLYNQVMTFLFEKYSDIDSINDLLAEMEREVIEPNQTTLKLLDTMLAVRQRVMKGEYGAAIKAVWGTEKFGRGFDVLGRWRARVEKVLVDQELRQERKRKLTEAKAKDNEPFEMRAE